MAEPDERFLSSGEEWLFKEVELLHNLHAEIRDTHLKYQSWFMVAQSVLLAAVVNLIVSGRFGGRERLFYVVCAVGFVLRAWTLQLRHIVDGDARMRRIRSLSIALRRPVETSRGGTAEFMAYIAGDATRSRPWKQFSYSRIRLIVDGVFPTLWVVLMCSRFT